MEDLTKNVKRLESAAKNAGLQINTQKSKYMTMSRHPDRIQLHHFVGHCPGGEILEIEKVKTVNSTLEFKYQKMEGGKKK